MYTDIKGTLKGFEERLGGLGQLISSSTIPLE
jgi:hypothetical protein